MTSLYHVLSFCRSYLRGARGAVPILQRTSKPRLGCPVTNTRYVFFLVTSPYIRCTIHRAHAKFPRPITCLSFRDIMDLAQKFERVACDKTISVTELDPNRKYRILRAKRPKTRFGPTAVLTIRDSVEAPAQVFLPRRYSDVVTDTDIEQINSNAVFLHLVYRGVCSTTKAYLLAIDVMHMFSLYYRYTLLA